MSKTKRLEVIFHNGKPDGVRTYMRYLSPVTAYVVPRPLLNDAKKITGINRQGVYFLINDFDGALTQLYIGQTQNGITRLIDHNITKDFWNKAILFSSDNQHFTLNIISGLEEYAIIKANEANRYKVENKVTPQFKISEYDMPIIEEIYEEIEFVMATLGYKLYSSTETGIEETVYKTGRRGIIALGTYSSEKFELLPGSQIDIEKPSNLASHNIKRQELLDSNGIIKADDGKYYLQVIVEFKSPSGAGDFVLGGSTNGWVEWKDSNGKTLDELFRQS
ncbi:GIY-YIG nuclease family protein [Oscillospiraceae bacterium OttesenSCG-928-F05]|nr:GIY-YIG nuclease family protein [Oscillospiraceae bacterium OttesenSCG-928-F05]